ncbi:MAG: hypothetical protein Q7J66_24895, partial [Hydrogenophaga sp.]|nr:hypothetical protein [Hydrogenophaga sp.]
NQTAIPGHGTGPLLPVLPVTTGRDPPSSVPAHRALIKNKNWGRMNCTPKVGHQSNRWGVFHDETQ